MAGIRNQLGVLVQGALGILERLRHKLLSPLSEHSLVDNQVEPSRLGIDNDLVAVADETNGAALLSLGHNMSNQEAVGATGEAAIGDESHVVAEAGAHDGGRGLEHLDHAGGALGALVADNDNCLLALLDLAALKGLTEGVLAVEGACSTLEAEALLAGDLTDGAAGGQRAAEDLDVAGGLDGVGEGADDLLAGGEAVNLFEVLGEGQAGDGLDGAVDEVVLKEVLEEGGGSADALDVGHDVLAGGLEVGEEGDAVRNGLEVVDGQLDPDTVGDGDQVEDGVGGASGDVDYHHGVLEGGAGQDIARTDVLLKEVPDGGTGSQALVVLGLGLGGVRGRAGESHSHGLESGGHGVGGVHSTTGAGTGASMADDVVALGLVDVLGDVLSVGLESCKRVSPVVGRSVMAGSLPETISISALFWHEDFPALIVPP